MITQDHSFRGSNTRQANKYDSNEISTVIEVEDGGVVGGVVGGALLGVVGGT